MCGFKLNPVRPAGAEQRLSLHTIRMRFNQQMTPIFEKLKRLEELVEEEKCKIKLSSSFSSFGHC